MESTGTVVIFFYGLFWAAALGSAARYRPFDTSGFWTADRNYVAPRLILSFLIVNILPLVGLWVTYGLFTALFRAVTLPVLLGAALASLSVFGMPRVLHAFIFADRYRSGFYSPAQASQVAAAIPSANSGSFAAHALPALGFLLGFPLLGVTTAHASESVIGAVMGLLFASGLVLAEVRRRRHPEMAIQDATEGVHREGADNAIVSR
jgi:positive regulator of sigma E activity